jgi:hypothetical protein
LGPRFTHFHNVRHPAESEINAFLTHLAVKEKVSASTQNQALSALLIWISQPVRVGCETKGYFADPHKTSRSQLRKGADSRASSDCGRSLRRFNDELCGSEATVQNIMRIDPIIARGQHMNKRELWSRILIVVGSIAMLVGAIDPMEGSLLILPGSALLALGTYLGQRERRLFAYRVWVFILIAAGVGALWGLNAVGGFGGPSGRPMWWGVLILPYLIGWSVGIWGPDSPRWMLWLGIAVALWYLTIPAMALRGPHPTIPNGPGMVLGATGVLTIGGCIYRLRRRVSV